MWKCQKKKRTKKKSQPLLKRKRDEMAGRAQISKEFGAWDSKDPCRVKVGVQVRGPWRLSGGSTGEKKSAEKGDARIFIEGKGSAKQRVH